MMIHDDTSSAYISKSVGIGPSGMHDASSVKKIADTSRTRWHNSEPYWMVKDGEMVHAIKVIKAYAHKRKPGQGERNKQRRKRSATTEN